MKKTAKLFGIAGLMLLILFSMVTCDTNSDSAPKSPYLGEALVVTDQQVYERNNLSHKVSTMHLLYKGNLTIDAYVHDKNGWEVVSEDHGKIIDGKFSITVPGLADDELVTGDALLSYLPFWYDTSACAIDIVSDATSETPGISLKGESIGNLVNFYLAPASPPPGEILMREGFSGTQSSMSGEEIYYFYVNQNCTITANKGEDPILMYTFTPLNLSLKAGWNTVCMKETYTVSGNSTYSAEVRNPDIAWTIMPPLPF